MSRFVLVSSALLAACSDVADRTTTAVPVATSPTFVHAPGSPIAIGEAVAHPLLADVDGDRKLDIVVSYSVRSTADPGKPTAWTGAVAVLLGDGRGSFRVVEPRVRHAAGGLRVAIGDVDSDGAVDLALVGHDEYDVTLLRGDGNGGFGEPRVVKTSGGDSPHTHSVVLADMNADKKLDLIAGHAEDGRVAVLLGDGKGGFTSTEGSPFVAGNHPYEGLTARDLDRDGDLDVVVPDIKGNALTVMQGDGSGMLARDSSRPFPTGPRPGFLAAGDLDGNGADDVALTHDDDPLLVVWWSEKDQVCMRKTTLTLETQAWGAVIGDFDRDGRNDLALGEHEKSVSIFFGGEGEFPARRMRVPVGGRAPGYLAAGDVDGDGALDLVTGNHQSGDVSVLLASRG